MLNAPHQKDYMASQRARGRRSITLLVLLIILLVVVSCILGFVQAHYNKLQFGFSVDPTSEVLHENVIAVKGWATGAEKVELLVNGSSVDTLAVGEREDFLFEGVVLQTGWNLIELRAYASAYIVGFHKAAQIQILYQPDPPTIPIISELPAITNKRKLSVTGKVDPEATVIIEINQLLEPSKQYNWIQNEEGRSNSEGVFRKEIILPLPGAYSIKTYVLNQRGTRSDTSKELRVEYNPKWAPENSPINRNIHVSISYRTCDVTVEAVLSRDNPLLLSLKHGDITFPQFAAQIFSQNLAEYWLTESPTITYSVTPDDLVSVRASAKPFIPDLPILSGRVSLPGLNKLNSKDGKDTYSITVDDYSVDSYNIEPAQQKERTATWYSHRGDKDLQGGIELSLRYSVIKHPSNLFRFIQAVVYGPVLFPWSSLSLLLMGFYISIPMVWLLWILQTQDVAFSHKFYLEELRFVTKFSVILTFITSILWSSYEFSFFLFNNQDKWPAIKTTLERYFSNVSADPGFVYVNCIITLPLLFTCSALLTLITRPFKHSAILFWLNQWSLGISYAAMVCISINIAALALGQLPPTVVIRRTTATIIILPFLLLILLLVRRLLRPQSNSPFHLITWGKFSLPIVVLITLFFWYTFELPNLTNSAMALTTTQWNYINIGMFFESVHNIIQYFPLLGILLLFHRIKDTERLYELLTSRLAKLLFTVYLVGTFVNWLRLPMSFLLAFIIFPKLVFVSDEKKAFLNRIRQQILLNRGELLSKIVMFTEAEQLRQALKKLKKKVIDGELSIEAYETKRTEIEGHISKSESETKIGDVKAQDVVLRIGLSETNWNNGVRGIKYALGLSLPWYVIYFWRSFASGEWKQYPYMNLVHITSNFIGGTIDWLVAAFFFGYYFIYIRGNTGLRKGLVISGVLIICLLPTWVISAAETANIKDVTLYTLLYGTLQVYFFTALGLWAFDYISFKGALGHQFEWRKFAGFGEFSSITAVSSLLLAGLSGIVWSVLTGQFKTILEQILKASVSNMPGVLPR